MSEEAAVTSFIGAAVAILGYCITVFLYINTRMASVSEKIDLKIQALDEKSSKARHDTRNEFSSLFAKAEARLSVLEREVVRDSDMAALETRIMSQLTEFRSDFKGFCNDMTAQIRAITRSVDKLDPSGK